MFLRLDRKGPIYGQIYRALRIRILDGELSSGVRVPSTRSLSAELGVSRTIVVLAYEQLLDEGYLAARTGAGTFAASELPESLTTVAGSAPVTRERRDAAVPRLSCYAIRITDESKTAELTRERRRSPLPYDFLYGRPSFADFSHSTWSRLITRRIRRAASRDLGYGPPEGAAALREVLADYLRRARAVSCDPDQILIVSGSRQALDLATRVLINPGDRVALEEPHYHAARSTLRAAGARIEPVAVDALGMRVDDLARRKGHFRLAFVTPSHQFPTGALMPLSRRLELLDWAERSGALIFEDDYDSEYRYRGRPVEALQALDQRASVLYAGSFSKSIFPSLRLGYLVVPKHLVGVFRSVKALLDTGCSTSPQLALADFIRGGHFERHLRRSRARNAARREALLKALDQHVGDRGQLAASDAGLHVLLWLSGTSFSHTAEICREAAKVGVGVYSVGSCFCTPPKSAGLLLGYASLTEREITEGIRRLASVLP
jgi:GntR family transcriptional regulator/MocR family aminotransferase